MELPEEKLKELEREAKKFDPCHSVPGFSTMTPAEQAELRLQMALKAATAADDKLKKQGVIPETVASNTSLSVLAMERDQTTRRARAIEGIENEGFAPVDFTSSKANPAALSIDSAHDMAMFTVGDEPIMLKALPSKELQLKDKESLMHPNLYVKASEKMEMWKVKLATMRRRKLEGNAG